MPAVDVLVAARQILVVSGVSFPMLGCGKTLTKDESENAGTGDTTARRMITSVGVASVKGLNHHLNEDRYRLLGGNVPVVEHAHRGHLFAVMDGVGSAPKGMRAAQCVADTLTRFYTDPTVPDTADGVARLLEAANQEINAWGTMPGSDRPLGAAAATAAWFAPTRKVVLFHSGDTVAFHFDGRGIRRLTREHTDGRAITAYVGQGASFRLDVERVAFEVGDVLCLVTDGVTKSMVDGDVEAVLAELTPPDAAARELVARARGKGSRDDITAVVVELAEW